MSPLGHERRTERGFTIIELMISLLIASLLVIMILAIFSRLSFAYREQQDIAGVTQKLTGARQLIELDAKQAGLGMSQGFKMAADTNLHSPVVIANSSADPDAVGFYYADKETQALVTAGTALTLTVDDATGFVDNQLVVLSTADTTTATNPVDPTNDAKITTFDACVLQIATVVGTTITFTTSGDWGTATNAFCNVAANKTMMYGFVAHYWRIDPARPDLGVLQLGSTGNLVGTETWADEAYGFTDLQLSTYFYDDATDNTDTADPDSDGARDWYSDNAQAALTAPIIATANFTPPLLMTMSFVARTDRDVEGVYTSATPDLIGAVGGTDHNMIGDRASLSLPNVDPRLTGLRIYRYVTFQVDLRNLGVGR